MSKVTPGESINDVGDKKSNNVFALVTALIAIGLLVAAVTLRGMTDGKWKINRDDAIIVATAVGLSLVITGRVKKLVLGKEGFTLETAEGAIVHSAKQPIKAQVIELPINKIVEAKKEGVEKIPDFARQRVQGLDLTLGWQGDYYLGGAVQEYLKKLSPYSFFRYVILLHQDGALFGMFEARDLAAYIDIDKDNPQLADAFAKDVNAGGEENKRKLSAIPGFVPASDAVSSDIDKRAALDKMEKLSHEWLPVVSEEGKLKGVIERPRLVASMILEVTNLLKASKSS